MQRIRGWGADIFRFISDTTMLVVGPVYSDPESTTLLLKIDPYRGLPFGLDQNGNLVRGVGKPRSILRRYVKTEVTVPGQVARTLFEHCDDLRCYPADPHELAQVTEKWQKWADDLSVRIGHDLRESAQYWGVDVEGLTNPQIKTRLRAAKRELRRQHKEPPGKQELLEKREREAQERVAEVRELFRQKADRAAALACERAKRMYEEYDYLAQLMAAHIANGLATDSRIVRLSDEKELRVVEVREVEIIADSIFKVNAGRLWCRLFPDEFKLP